MNMNIKLKKIKHMNVKHTRFLKNEKIMITWENMNKSENYVNVNKEELKKNELFVNQEN